MKNNVKRRSLVEELLFSIYPRHGCRRRFGSGYSEPNRKTNGSYNALKTNLNSQENDQNMDESDFQEIDLQPTSLRMKNNEEMRSRSSRGSISEMSDFCDCSFCMDRAPSVMSMFADDSEDTGTLTEYSTTSDFDRTKKSACEALTMRPQRRQKLLNNSKY